MSNGIDNDCKKVYTKNENGSSIYYEVGLLNAWFHAKAENLQSAYANVKKS